MANGEVGSSTALLDKAPEVKAHDSAAYLVTKRAIDILGSTVALIVTSPIVLGFALAIYLDDPHGSPFFSQVRVGKDGKEV